MYKKVYVDVVLLQDKYGKCRPLRIQWEDGTVYSVERINRTFRLLPLKIT